MIRILKEDWLNLQDDIIFNNPSIVLYAEGCKFNCKYCHSKSTWNGKGYELDYNKFSMKVKDVLNNLEELTIIGEGGDFYWQIKEWNEFVKNVKSDFGNRVKLLWFTGATLTEVIDVINDYYDLILIDCIICGRPFYDRNEGNYKWLYFPFTNESELVKILEDGKYIKEVNDLHFSDLLL